MVLLEVVGGLADLDDLFGFTEFGAVDATDGTDHGLVPPPDLLEGRADFAQGRASACRLDGERQQIALHLAGSGPW